jgi:hypothetical protein
MSGIGPRGYAAGQCADDAVVADVDRVPEDVGCGLVGVAHDDDRRGGIDDPAEPGREPGPQGDRDRAGKVAGGDVGDRAYVDDDGSPAEPDVYLLDVQLRQRRLRAGRVGRTAQTAWPTLQSQAEE